MKPEDTQNSNPSTTHTRDGLRVPARESAANLIRSQLDELYSSQPQQTTIDKSMLSKHKKTVVQPIDQAHDASQSAPAIDANQWKQYHSAWQDYYQKYYQHYYTSYAHKVINEHDARLAKQAPSAKPAEPAIAEQAKAQTDAVKKEELTKLREKIIMGAQESAKKARGSRHFIPVAAAICVVLIFGFLQYNQILMANVQAYISPGAIEPQNIVVDPSTDVAVSPEPKLIIPKLNINVPVVYGVGAGDKEQLAAMEHGVAHWPGGDQAKSVPGQAGNTVIAGHSSNDLFESGDYKFVFSQLDRLENGDTIYANYEGKRYTYTVTRKDIILPKGQWQSVIQQTDKPKLVLVTCWPLGTAQKRMLITAEQVSPDPTSVAPAPATDENVPTTEGLAGNSPTFFEWLFGLFS